MTIDIYEDELPAPLFAGLSAEDQTRLVDRINQITPRPKIRKATGNTREAAIVGAGFLAKVAIDLGVKFLEAQAAKHQATFSTAIIGYDMADYFGGDRIILQVRRMLDDRIAFNSIFVFSKAGAAHYVVHPVFLRVDESKAVIWNFKETETVAIKCEVAAAKKTEVIALTVQKVRIGQSYFFPRRVDSNGRLGPMQFPNTIGFFQSPAGGVPGKVIISISETDEGKAQKILAKAAKTLKEKEGDILKAVAQ